MKRALLIMSLAAVAGCGTSSEPGASPESNTVETSGKKGTALADVPEPVLAAARAAQPQMTVKAAEAEVRDGRNYYDVGGTLPDGSEIELDMLREGTGWKVVETQRDIAFAAAPEPVRAASVKADSAFAP